MMKRWVVYFLFFPFVLSAQAIVTDRAKSDQLRSMVYRQWKFSPEWYYYSWWKKKYLGVTVKLPGLGMHQNYIRNYNKNITQMEPLVVANKANESQFDEAKTHNEKVYNQEIKLYADRTIDYEYSLKKRDFEMLKNLIRKEVALFSRNGVSLDNMQVLYNEFERINKGVSIIQSAHLSNAERRESYLEFEEAYQKLLISCRRLNEIHATIKKNSNLKLD